MQSSPAKTLHPMGMAFLYLKVDRPCRFTWPSGNPSQQVQAEVRLLEVSLFTTLYFSLRKAKGLLTVLCYFWPVASRVYPPGGGPHVARRVGDRVQPRQILDHRGCFSLIFLHLSYHEVYCIFKLKSNVFAQPSSDLNPLAYCALNEYISGYTSRPLYRQHM